jgi:hypothetical protein
MSFELDGTVATEMVTPIGNDPVECTTREPGYLSQFRCFGPIEGTDKVKNAG